MNTNQKLLHYYKIPRGIYTTFPKYPKLLKNIKDKKQEVQTSKNRFHEEIIQWKQKKRRKVSKMTINIRYELWPLDISSKNKRKTDYYSNYSQSVGTGILLSALVN